MCRIIADPVAGGFVDTLARPGGNANGFMFFEYSARNEELTGTFFEWSKRRLSRRRNDENTSATKGNSSPP